jgi:hypothetical protein
MKTAQTLSKRTPTAEKVLAAYPDSKDNYAYFIALCWQEDGFLNLSPIELEAMRFAPSPESYSRLKRLKVAKGEVILSPKTTKRNTELKDDSKYHYGKTKGLNQTTEPQKTFTIEYYKDAQGYDVARRVYS